MTMTTTTTNTGERERKTEREEQKQPNQKEHKDEEETKEKTITIHSYQSIMSRWMYPIPERKKGRRPKDVRSPRAQRLEGAAVQASATNGKERNGKKQ